MVGIWCLAAHVSLNDRWSGLETTFPAAEPICEVEVQPRCQLALDSGAGSDPLAAATFRWSWRLRRRRRTSWPRPRAESMPPRPRQGSVMATTLPRTHLTPAHAPEQAASPLSFQERRKP